MKQTASRAQLHQIGEALTAALVPVDEGAPRPSPHTYKEGISDTTIAAAIGVSVSTVSGYRREVFGPFPGNPRQKSKDRLGAIEKRLDSLEKRIVELTAGQRHEDRLVPRGTAGGAAPAPLLSGTEAPADADR